MVFAIHQYESATGIHVALHPNPSHLCPHPIPLGYHTSNLHWLPILHMVMYVLQCYSLTPSHPLLLPKPRKDLEVTSLWI